MAEKKYIERDRLYELSYWHGATPTLEDPFPDGVDAVDTNDIDSIPAADVRPVVLCRDCKNNYNTCLNHGINEPMCDFTDRKLKEDDFCSRGEKRGEN